MKFLGIGGMFCYIARHEEHEAEKQTPFAPIPERSGMANGGFKFGDWVGGKNVGALQALQRADETFARFAFSEVYPGKISERQSRGVDGEIKASGHF